MGITLSFPMRLNPIGWYQDHSFKLLKRFMTLLACVI